MLSAELLKTELKTPLVAFWNQCWNGDNGMTIEQYADAFAEIIAGKVINHIKNNAQVSTTITGTATGAGGPYPVTGTGTGGIS